MTGLMPVTNCRCLALVERSYTRNTTKLAGTKDMATMMKMEMRTSEPSNLKPDIPVLHIQVVYPVPFIDIQVV